MKLAVTGADGFLGWHLRCRAFAAGVECLPISRDLLTDADRLADMLSDVDAVVHCAGVNRGTDIEVTEGNLDAARRLAEAVGCAEGRVRIVYANSTHSRGDSAYGAAKRKAADILAGASASAAFSDVVLPNLFGEHGRPHYNSFVATFCHEVAAGREPTLVEDRRVPLLHVQDAAEVLIQEAYATGCRVVDPSAESMAVSAVLQLLKDFESVYASGELPDIGDHVRARLFNTYRSYLFPARYPMNGQTRTDARGTLLECVRTGTTGGQAFVSSTEPGAVRGEHVHLRKFERFMVVAGEAEIALRRLFTDQVVRFHVTGERPVIIDMPTMWAHNLTNVGDRTVMAFFWTNELYSADDPDTFPSPVGTDNPFP